MSNKIVPGIYRSVIDDVITSIKPEFDEYGVDENVLADLQQKWQNKVIASHVAEFETAPPPPAPQHHPQHPAHAHPHAYPQMHMHPQFPHYAAPPQVPHVKQEPVDRYVYSIPALPGPQLNGAGPSARPPGPHPQGQQGVLSFPSGPPLARQSAPGPSPSPKPRIPQVDGPSSSSASDSPSPPATYPYPSSHPSLPQQTTPSSTIQDDEAINSDLDDSSTEDEDDADEGAVGETDIVFCTYDKIEKPRSKVARVKNKWKCVLKDGMIHINGKDYLFAKCSGEFEW